MKKAVLGVVLLLLAALCALYFFTKPPASPWFLTVFLLASLLVCAFQLLYLMVPGAEKNTAPAVKKDNISVPGCSFDDLETELMLLSEKKYVYSYMIKWLRGYFPFSFIAFVRCRKDGTIEVIRYEEHVPSEKNFNAMTAVISRAAENTPPFYLEGGYAVSYMRDEFSHAVLLAGDAADRHLPDDSVRSLLIPAARILGKAVLLAEAGKLTREKSQLQYAFSRYISPEFVNKIVHDPDALHVGGETKCLSVIFTDLRGFTSLSESMDPVQLLRVLNMYLNEMSEVIIALGGTIDKFEGDAILAFFGAPVSIPDHAVRCCRAALRMKKMEQILNEQLINEKLIPAPLFTRIGINSGDMIVGNIGSLKRLDYTIIGSNVNIAARIENINKRYDTSVLISEHTRELLPDTFSVRYVDTVELRGVSHTVKLYELLEEKEPQPEIEELAEIGELEEVL